MFANLLSSLQLSDPSDAEEQGTNSSNAEATDEGSSSASQGGHVSFWGVAAAVAGTVRATADDFVKTVKQTDWQSELTNFGKEVAHDTKAIGNNAVHLVDQLPLHLDNASEEVYPGDQHFLTATADGSADDIVAAHFEQVGSALANFGRTLVEGTQELVGQVRQAVESEIATVVKNQKPNDQGQSGAGSGSRLQSSAGKYNRFEAEVTAMQRDSSTYCDEPEDKEDFAAWKATFNLPGMKKEIGKIITQNAFMAELQARIVPMIVEYEDFWTRYFYRLHKLQLKEAQRQELHSRMAKEEDAEVSWDDDDTTKSPTSETKPSPAVPSTKPTPATSRQPVKETSRQPAKETAPIDKPQEVSTSQSAFAAQPRPRVPTTQPAKVASTALTDTATAATIVSPSASTTDPAGANEAASSTLAPTSTTTTVQQATAPVSAAPAPAPVSATAAATHVGTAAAATAPVTAAAAAASPSSTADVASNEATSISGRMSTPTPSQSTEGKPVASSSPAAVAEVEVHAQPKTVSQPSSATSATDTATDAGDDLADGAKLAEGTSIADGTSKPLEREGSIQDGGSDITSPEWCMVSNASASASDAGVTSLDPRTDRDASHTVASSEPLDEEDEDEELAGVTADGAEGEDDDEEVDEDWGNWG